MSNGTSSMLVAVANDFVCVRIAGRANFAASVDFKTLVSELRARGHQRFLLDLAACPIMDSTFLGVLAGFAQKLADAPSALETPFVELINPNDRVLGLLDNLGVLELFKVVQCAPTPDAQFEPVKSVAAETSKTDMSRNCLEAHRTLMALNPENVARFKDVTKFIEEDLKRQAGN